MIDVLLSCRNSSSTIEDCLDSILCQTHEDFNLYVFDDASTDDTVDKVKSYRDDRLFLISSKSNIGTYASKNFMLKNFCSSCLVALHDADDVSHPDRFLRQVRELDETTAVCVGTAVLETWKLGSYPHTKCTTTTSAKFKRVNYYPPRIYMGMFKHALSQNQLGVEHELFLKYKFCMNGSVMFKREALLKVGGWDGTTFIGADTDMFVRLLAVGDVKNTRDVLYERRFHENSLTSSETYGMGSPARELYSKRLVETAKTVAQDKIVHRSFFHPNFEYEVTHCVG